MLTICKTYFQTLHSISEIILSKIDAEIVINRCFGLLEFKYVATSPIIISILPLYFKKKVSNFLLRVQFDPQISSRKSFLWGNKYIESVFESTFFVK